MPRLGHPGTGAANDTAADGNAATDGGEAAESSQGTGSNGSGKRKGAGKSPGKAPAHDSPAEFWDKLVSRRRLNHAVARQRSRGAYSVAVVRFDVVAHLNSTASFMSNCESCKTWTSS